VSPTSDAERGDPGLARGFLAALPLFLAYELGLLATSPEARASAERVFGLALPWLGPRLQLVRMLALLAASAACLWRLARATPSPATGSRAILREVGEGLLAGFLLAPALALLSVWLGAEPLGVGREPVRELDRLLRLIGAAPWEELLFRVAAYGGLFLVARRALLFLGLARAPSTLAAELAAVLGSALVFAWFHLASAQRLLGLRGEPFDVGVFTWRVSAGVLLAALFRWRGFGVAAWAHALYNLGLALGIGRG
jgi:hypothetical protein